MKNINDTSGRGGAGRGGASAVNKKTTGYLGRIVTLDNMQRLNAKNMDK
jgi:hypothetical protein